MAKVLIIDANDYHAGLLSSQLRALGYEVILANRGHKGISIALKNPPDLILMDSFLPDQTGFQMCNQLRRNKSTQSVPIVMMSGIAHFPNQQTFAMERGATAYVSKPQVTIEVGEIVDKYITRRPEGPIPLPAGPIPLPAADAPVESSPQGQSQYTVSTEVHSALSSRLREAIDEIKKNHLF